MNADRPQTTHTPTTHPQPPHSLRVSVSRSLAGEKRKMATLKSKCSINGEASFDETRNFRNFPLTISILSGFAIRERLRCDCSTADCLLHPRRQSPSPHLRFKVTKRTQKHNESNFIFGINKSRFRSESTNNMEKLLL
jgi:hypothetical protein